MIRLRYVLAALLPLAAIVIPAQTLPDLYHNETHGDPPYLSESGWQPLLNGHDLSGWHGLPGQPDDWYTTRSVTWARIFNPVHLTGKAVPGDRIVNGPSNKTANLVTDEKFGSFEFYAEFMLAKGSNSGIYLHGLYEVQIFDSYGFKGNMTLGDCGGIYERDDSTGGNPPLVNAAKPPGEWQSVHIWFQAPQFDASGHKIAPARVLRVLLNEIPVQEDVPVPSPTRSHMEIPEAATNPIMLQGDHSAIAYRNIYIKPFQVE